jgi:MFS family permease
VKFGSYANLLGHPRWRKNAWLALAGCSAGIIGLWGIGNFHPIITRSIIGEHLKAANLSADDMVRAKAFWSSAGLLLQNIGGFFGMYLLAKIAEHKGRKIAFSLSLILSFASTILVFWFMRDYGDLWMLAVMGFGQLSVFAVYAIYLPELFPTSLRSTGTSFCYNVGRIVAATAPFTLSKITASFGGDIAAFRIGGLCVSAVLLLGLFVVPFLPETKGQPLPDE